MGYFSFGNCYFSNTENEGVLMSKKWYRTNKTDGQNIPIQE